MDAKEIVKQMSLDEKAALLTGEDTWHIRNCPRLGVERTMVSDGPHGLRKQVGESDNMGFNGSIQAVCFPSASGLASTFHPEALQQLGETLGKECQAENISVLLGPGVNMKRSPLCGRNFEYFSEDPYLAGKLAAAYVRGVQSQGVGTSVKHFAANNQEYRRMSISDVVDERALREIYLAAFETVVKESQPWTVMCSYNQINGTFSSENKWLLHQVLREEWGFQGYVVTDWGASCHRVRGVAAGCDLEMPSSGERNTRRIIKAVQDGKLKESDVDLCAQRILEVSQRYLEQKKTVEFDREHDHQVARELARECMVLLKNEENLLPLAKGKKVAFLGEFAKKPRYQGGGSSHINPYRVVSAWEAIQGKAEATFASGYHIETLEPEEDLIQEAVRTAQEADVAVVFVGLTDRMESEGYDRKHLDLPESHNRLIEAVAKVQKNTVVVLHNGAPVLMPWLDQVGAVLEAYLSGEACGEAVVDLLLGEANPSGKLAETFPLSLKDVPCVNHFPGNPLTVEYRESIYIGYRYYDKVEQPVLFPFGHGLSYTQFEYSNLKIEAKKGRGIPAAVSADIRNCGACDGAETVQLYISAPGEQGFRPLRELKGFQKIFLKKGESKRVEFTLEERAFAYYNAENHTWEAPDGEYTVFLGSSSRDLRLHDVVKLQNSPSSAFAYTKEKYPSYFSGRVQTVPDSEFETLLGQKIPPAKMLPGARFTVHNSLDDAKETKWGMRFIQLLTNVAGEKYADYLEAALTAPIRAIVGTFGSVIREKEAVAIVHLLNNEKVLGSLAVLLKRIASIKLGKKK